MGRFYQTSQPRFVDKNIYEAPIQLMQGVLANAEQRTDQLVAQSEMLEGVTDQISHLNFDTENERVKALQDKYGNKINEITDAIYADPLNWQKHRPDLKNLQKEMLKDKTSGEWFSIESRYNDYAQWVEDNKDLRDSNPNLYNRLANHYYQDVVTRATDDPLARFQGQKGIDRPDLIKGYREVFENIKANSIQQSDGKYMYKDKVLSEDEVANIAWNTLLSDPQYSGYINQMGNVLGDQGYYDENGRPMNAFDLVDGDGNVITYDEYMQLPDEEKGNVSRQLNPGHAFYSDLASVAQTYGFSEREMSVDQYGLATHKGNITSGHIAQRGNNAIQLEYLRQQGRHDLLDHQYANMEDYDRFKFKLDLQEKAAGGDKDALNTLNHLNAVETIGIMPPPPASLSGDRELIDGNREKKNLPNDGKAYFTAPAGTLEYAAEQRWKNSTEYAMKENGETVIELSNGSSFKAQEYFDWLGPREHSEELSREFLEKKGIYVRTEGSNVSTAQGWANETRWMPEWSKSDAAVDWDKLYQAGEAYEESRNTWYEEIYTKPSQVSLQPITNIETNGNMIGEMNRNYNSYYMVNANGEMLDEEDKDEYLQNLDGSSQVYVTSANSHGELGMNVEINGENYYVFPNEGNTAASEVMIEHSIRGVDPNSQYYYEMTDRLSNNLLSDLNQTGENSSGTKSIVRKVNGELVSLELVGDQVYVREPDANLNSEPKAVFDDIHHFVRAVYYEPPAGTP